jgi:hypothetical protein
MEARLRATREMLLAKGKKAGMTISRWIGFRK